jgi:hypothetical protein
MRAMSVTEQRYKAVLAVGDGRTVNEVGYGAAPGGSSELHEAVKGADGLGDPASRWRARADLAGILGAMGDDAGQESMSRGAAGIIREIEAGLAPERAKRFVATPQVARVLSTIP